VPSGASLNFSLTSSREISPQYQSFLLPGVAKDGQPNPEALLVATDGPTEAASGGAGRALAGEPRKDESPDAITANVVEPLWLLKKPWLS